jgi:hypothetical protein
MRQRIWEPNLIQRSMQSATNRRKSMKTTISLCIVAFGLAAGALADEKKVDTRGGNCEDANSQVEYFCKSNPNDTMVAIGTACTNAKKNAQAACEGKVEADKKYEFKDK